ncbi:bifunctional YncE family protein/alkaline phosphatase family protein [Kamptonema cortianum]|nr:bifunctional YncE family protein/alkaline phosphatase family protein [Geitlerinema splendidum]MDK3158664.1 bifunctional YncE family protein/alkaline phosphatase family protein [Kamptonema cortianum]
MLRRFGLLIFAAAMLILGGCEAPKRVGPSNGYAVTSTGQIVRGAGERVSFAGRPVDSVASTDGKYVYVKDYNRFRVIDVAGWKEVGSAELPGGSSLYGIAVSPSKPEVYVTNSKKSLHVYDVSDSAKPRLSKSIELPGIDGRENSFPCGIALLDEGKRALVCLSLNNSVATVELESGVVESEIAVGVAPYCVVFSEKFGLAIVSEQGGPRPDEDADTAPSGGTDVEVDDRGVAESGTVALVNLESGEVSKRVVTGLQPSEIALSPDQSLAYVCNSNADTVSILDIEEASVKSTIEVKPDPQMPFGSMPNSVAVSGDNKRLYVANAGNNAVAVIDIGSQKPVGFIPTDWFPSDVLLLGNRLVITNNKGRGARADDAKPGAALNVHGKNGTLLKVRLPNSRQLGEYTRRVKSDSLVPQTLAALERSTNSLAKPVPIPAKLGEPSVFKHVIYVIKENRTYDQLFGDMPEGNGEPSLNIFGENVVPNQRALARQFVLLDNYYCNGVLSADGHSWATEGNVTPYLNRAFGGFTRSYTFGDDPITYSASGFIWDGVLAAGLSFRNYGEMDYAEPDPPMSGKELWQKYVAGEDLKFSQNIGITNLRRYSCREYPGWNMNIPDQLRMDRFLAEFKEFEKQGSMPNFMIIFLPQDHAGGAVSARSNVADNDLAVGRLVEAVSHSQFWKDTVIFINEDDPQAGTDHVDGHRSICLVVSPYSRNRGTVSDFFNQTSVLRTINQIFGIRPMNQRDSSSPLMTRCFVGESDLTPYKAIPNRVPLDEFPNVAQMNEKERKMYARVQQLDLREREVQTPAQMDLLNRWVWHSMKGFDRRYPAEWAGAHGKGLRARGLVLDDGVEEDD